MKKYLIFTFLFVTYTTLFHHALASIIVDESVVNLDISNEVEIVKVPRDFVIPNYKSLDFKKNEKNSLILGYNDGQTIIKIDILNKSSKDLERFLYLNSINGELELFKIDSDDMPIKLSTSGTDVPYKLRPQQGIYGALPVQLQKNSHTIYLIKLISRHNINSKLTFSDLIQLEKTERNRVEFLDFYSGGIILLVIYNIFIFMLLRENTYLYYCLYATSFSLATLSISGKLDQIIRLPYFTFAHYLICFSALAIFSASLFTYSFLDIKKYLPKFKNVFYFYFILTALLFLSGFFPFFEYHSKFFGLAIDLTIFTALSMFIYVAFKCLNRSPLALFYLISWGLVLIFLIIWFAMTFGILKLNVFTQNALPIGNMVEMLTLSLALAYKIQILNKEKINALSKARDKDKYERLVRVLSHDVANSLTIVMSYSKKLLKAPELSESSLKMSEKISASSENIHQILRIVREQEILVSKNKSLELIKVNALECINLSATLYEDALLQKNIKLDINIANDLTIKADKTCLVNNVFNNILSNAIKFSFVGGLIEIYQETTHQHLIIFFKDHGKGIHESLVNDIFFTDKIITSSGTNLEKGHGLGSNLVREYMFLFNGKIEVQSSTIERDANNHGTLIKLIFPRES